MRFTVNTRELTEAVSVVAKAMPVHSSLPILEGIYIRASMNTLFMKCSDLSLQIETEIPAVVDEEGCAVLPGRLFSELIKRFTDDNTSFDCKKNTMLLRSGRVKTSLQTNSADDYPEMVKVKEEFSAEIAQDVLKSMIRQTIFAVSYDESKPILNGICMKFSEDNVLSVVGLDGFRLAIRNEKIKNCTGKKSVVVPTRAAQEILNILSGDEKEIKLIFSSTHVELDFGGIKLISRLLDGEYLNYDNIIPKTFTTRVLINCADLQSSVERAQLLAREAKYNLVKLSFADDTLSVTANSEKGNIDDRLEIQLSGKDIDIAFNAKYLLDVTKVLEDETVYMNMNNPILPCVIVPTEGNAFYYMVLPVRMFSGM